MAYVDTSVPGDEFYMLNMYPYPSGSRLHVGHGRNYILGDALYRRERMAGRKALNPMGWDAFGLPAENAAIQSGVHPREYTLANIGRMKEQLYASGCLYDWSKELASCEPAYYRWNQWLFLRMWERGLAYRKTAPVNWCPGCRTVLANEQVVDGRCERSDDLVEIRDLTQWFFRVTDYAERLLDGLDRLPHWPERVKTMQRNWIGRSEGAEILFRVDGLAEPRQGLHDAAGHALRRDVPGARARARGRRAAGRALRPRRPRSRRSSSAFGASRASSARPRAREKEGLDTGVHRHQPGHGRADPGLARQLRPPRLRHRRDHGRPGPRPARLRVRAPLRPADPSGLPDGGRGEIDPGGDDRGASPRRRPRAGSGSWDGTPNGPEAVRVAIAWLEEKGFGKGKVGYRLRDWLISRQRYWGTPIPAIHCPACGVVPVPDADLPVLLPEDVEFRGDRGQPAREVRGLRARRAARSAADRRGARPTRWTPSSTRPGTTCGS